MVLTPARPGVPEVMSLRVVAILATGSIWTQSEAVLLLWSISPSAPTMAGLMRTPAVLQKRPGSSGCPPQTVAGWLWLSNRPRLTVKRTVAVSLRPSTVVPASHTHALPLRRQFQPIGLMLAVTVVVPLTKPGIGSFTTTPVVASPALRICSV